MLRLKELLKKKKITGKFLSEKVGITENALSMIINNKRQPRFELLLEIAKTLNVDIKDLFESTKETELIQLIVKNELHTFDGVDEAIKFLQNNGTI